MPQWLKTTLLVVVAVLVAMQFVRPARTNPPTEARQTLQAHAPDHPGTAVIARACRDCHTHETAWPWYSQIAPVSWLLAHDVNDGRQAVNFSTWATYNTERRVKLLREACEAAREGEMPIGIYTMMHADARLSNADVDAICALSSPGRSGD